jgi:general nucleoside transport system ATP-binding protein
MTESSPIAVSAGSSKDASAPDGAVVVAMRNIWKRFPGVIANREIDLDLRAGEVHALLGENGAGKSTLMHVLSGMYRPDDGAILLDGAPVVFRSPAQAIAAGIGMVHQHFQLVETQTAAENIHLGWGDTPWLASGRALSARTEELSSRFGLHVDPDAQIWQLSTGEQQRVEILRVLSRGARVLILDEPTSVLTPAEADELFRVVRSLAAEGRSIVLITHKLEEVLAASDQVTVLRGGRVVASLPTAGCDRPTLARLLIGQEIVSRLHREEREPGKPVLEICELSALGDRGLPALRGLSLTIREGEILGIAGVAGNGQSELAQALTGLRPIEHGSIVVDGVELTGASPARFVDAGVGHIPEDRLGMGLVATLTITDNAILREYRKPPLARGMRIDIKEATRFARDLVAQSAVRAPSTETPVRFLSGGNQQRLLAGRETRVASRLLIAVHPTQGLDIGATEELRRVLMEQRNRGSAVLLISEDLDEVLTLSDRVAVMYGGRIAGECDAGAVDREEIGLLMGGVKATEVSA